MFQRGKLHHCALVAAVITALVTPYSSYAFFDMLSSAIPIAACINSPKIPFMENDPPTEKAEQGMEKCKDPASNVVDNQEMDKNFKAKCEEGEISGVASESEDVSAIVYTLAFGACLSECIYPYSGGTVCTIGTLAGVAADLAGAANVAAKAEQSIGFLMQGGVTIGADVMIGGSVGNTVGKMFGGDEAADKVAKVGEENTKAVQEAKDKQQSEDRKAACISTALNAAMAIGRACKAKDFNAQSIKSFEEASDLHKEETISNMAAAASSDGSEKGGPRGGQQLEPGNPRATVAKKTKQSAADDKMKALEANAALGPVAQAFENRTGKPASEVLNRMAAGQHPLMAAAETIGGNEAIQAAAQLAAHAKEIQEVFNEEMGQMEAKGSMPSFESTGRSSKPLAQDSGMPDIAGMMAAFMPKTATKEKAPQGATGANLRAPAAAKVSSDGFHAPERSLFEIVGSRYHMVARRVLEDGPSNSMPSAPQPASLVPKNPYLGK